MELDGFDGTPDRFPHSDYPVGQQDCGDLKIRGDLSNLPQIIIITHLRMCERITSGYSYIY